MNRADNRQQYRHESSAACPAVLIVTVTCNCSVHTTVLLIKHDKHNKILLPRCIATVEYKTGNIC